MYRAVGRTAAQRKLLLIALIALVPFALLATWAHGLSPEASAAWERSVEAALALGTDAWSDLIRLINTLGNLPIWAAIVAVLAVLIYFARGLAGGILVGLSFLSDFAAFAVKVVVERARPETVATQHFFGPDSFSFPSGHVVRAVALATALAWVFAPPSARFKASVAAAVLGWLVMGYARVSLGVHWPTDTIGGALFGVAWFCVTAAIVAPLGVPVETVTPNLRK
jgi:membrane-associated phospholipid phosphatase